MQLKIKLREQPCNREELMLKQRGWFSERMELRCWEPSSPYIVLLQLGKPLTVTAYV